MPSKTKPTTAAAPAKAVIATPSTSQIGVSNSNLDASQVLLAFRALAAHTSRRTTTPSSALPLDGASGNLRDPSNAVYVQLTLNTLSPTSHVKPVRINLPHALHTPGEVSVCLLVKDPQREYKDLLVAQRIKCISRVVGVTKLKGKFKPFDARRALVQEHDIFLADSRIVPTLPNLCGKVFFDAKKNPLTVNLTKPSRIAEELEGAIQATTFTQNKGSCTTIKIGYLQKHTPEQLAENLLAAMPAVLSRVKGGWENVHNVEVKTGNSAALPVWNQRLGVKTHATPSVETADKAATTPAKRAAQTQVDATPSKSPVKKVQLAETAVKTPSPRKTRAAAAAKANNTVEAAATATPSKTPAKGTPRKTASSVSRSARKAK